MLNKVENISEFRRKFFSQFEKISKENIKLYKLIYETSLSNNVYIIGGFLRSIINKQPVRDIDVMFNGDRSLIERKLIAYDLNYKKNKLDGYKVQLETINVDLWCTETNWAFKNKLVKNPEVDILNKIAEGTFFNYDSLVFDIYSSTYSFKNYNACVESNTLDILRKTSKYKNENPGKIGNVLRSFQIRANTNLEFSINLCNYIINQINLVGLIKHNDIVEFLYNEASKTNRFNLLMNEALIEEYLIYVRNKIQGTYTSGDQLNLF